MANWLQRLEAVWSRRNVARPASPPEAGGRRPVCIVTGASEGIGRHLAGAFAETGHRLLLIARTAEALDRAAVELRRDHDAEVFTLALDLAQPDRLKPIRDALDANGLYADIVVNNAAIGLGGALAGQSEEKLEALCRLNIEALTDLTRAFLPDMLARARGGVLNVASIGALFPGPYQAAYYASKAYVLSLTEALAYENAGRGVRISALAPGPVATRFHERIGAQRAMYRILQPAMGAEAVARIGYSGFRGRRTIIVPGLVPSFNAFFVRYIPHFILVPFIGWFLKQRY